MRTAAFLFIFAFVALASAIHRSGSVEVDKWTFDKVVDGDLNALVVFQEHSWKEVNGFEKAVEELRDRQDLIIVRIDGSESSAEELKKRFHVEKLPAIRFVSEKTKAVSDFTGAENADEIVEFVRSAVSPALRSLADIARKFSAASDKKALLEEAKKIVGTVGETDANIGKLYIASMERIIEKGPSYVTQEVERLRKLVENKATTQAKKTEFGRRINILNVFASEAKNV